MGDVPGMGFTGDEDDLLEQEFKKLKKKQRQLEREARGENLEFPPDNPWYSEEDEDD